MGVGSSALLGLCHRSKTSELTRARLSPIMVDPNAAVRFEGEAALSFFAEAVEEKL